MKFHNKFIISKQMTMKYLSLFNIKSNKTMFLNKKNLKISMIMEIYVLK